MSILRNMTRRAKILLLLSCLFITTGGCVITVMNPFGILDYAILKHKHMEPSVCPRCNGRYLYVVYGIPTEDSIRLKQKGYISLGGCCVDSTKGNRICMDCGYPKRKLKPNESNESHSIIFLGHEICYNMNDLSQQFARICSEDDNLIYDSLTQNITIYETTFHLNYHMKEKGFMLMSSVQPDAKQMHKVIKAISNYHGKEMLDEPNNYLWWPELNDSIKSPKNYPYIRLRRVHSDEGGTVIIVK